MSVVASQVQSLLDQLYAEAGNVPGTWLVDSSLTYAKAAPNEFASYATGAANAADILANAADIGTNAGAITALQNLLGTDASYDNASLTYVISDTLTLPNTPVAGRRLDVFTNGRLRQEGVEYSISGDTITWLVARTAVPVTVRYVY